MSSWSVLPKPGALRRRRIGPTLAARPQVSIVLAAIGSMCLAPGVARRAGIEPRSASAAAPTVPTATATANDAPPEPPPARLGAEPSDSRAHDLLADASLVRDVTAFPGAQPRGAALAIDGRDDTAWTGRPGAGAWQWRATFQRPVHVSLLRARFGVDATRGIPTSLHWEASRPDAAGACPAEGDDDAFASIADAFDDGTGGAVRPTRRSWFVDVDACALRLRISATNAGPPVVRELSAFEGAEDVLRGGSAESDPPSPTAYGAIDGTYDHGWTGAAGAARWVLTVRLPRPTLVDRAHLVLGLDATSTPRPKGIGRSFGVAFGPARYRIQASEDGSAFFDVGHEPHAPDGAIVPVRRRLVAFAPRTVRALRLVIDGATGEDGRPDPSAGPVVREFSAYGGADDRPLLLAPWILSVNANPAAASHLPTDDDDEALGELANDAYWTKYIQGRFSPWIPALRRDDRYWRTLGNFGQLLTADRDDASGVALEAIEGDDPTLDLPLLEGSTPRPIVVLSGSNPWDFARATGPDGADRKHWRWDPLRDAKDGGMGQLWRAVARRSVPILGYCGGAQILALLEARAHGTRTSFTDTDNAALIDEVLRRTTGQSIHGVLPKDAIVRAWPGDGHPQPEVVFRADDPLFTDLAGPSHRRSTRAFPESHADVVRPAVFYPGQPLAGFEILARSVFCGKNVVDGGPRDHAFPNPDGPGRCMTVPEIWRAKGPGWPMIGTQFHAEQYDFTAPAKGDPPESVADPRLLVAAQYESIVDSYLRSLP